MKKLCAVLLAVMLALSFAACGKKPEADKMTAKGLPAPDTTVSETTEEEPTDVETKTSEDSGSIPEPEEALVPGNLYYFEQEEVRAVSSLALSGNVCGSEINNKNRDREGIRCIFELNEWVEFLIGARVNYLTVWVYKHDGSIMKYQRMDFPEDQDDYEYVDCIHLENESDDRTIPWGSFYLNPDDCEPGYYDIVFVYDGRAHACIVTRFYEEGQLRDLSDEELEELMLTAFDEAN